jgi:uncharacterized protein (TIGR02145 family)
MHQLLIAQSVGIGTTTPNRSAKLEVQSSNSGFLPPRMTLTERDAIASPAAGLMIYCSDCGANGTGEMNYYNGQNWVTMNMEQSGGSGATSLPRTSIGSQVWSTKNLDVVKYRNGDPIPYVPDSAQWKNLTSGAWCWYNNDSATYAAKYGRLYNWYAVNDPRGLAPQGWHVPSNAEWNLLIKNTDPNADTTILRGTFSLVGGDNLKNSSGWRDFPDSLCSTCVNGSNTSGLSAMPGGYRFPSGRGYSAAGFLGSFWSSSEVDSAKAKGILLFSVHNEITRIEYFKKGGYSVRVLRNQPAIGPYLPIIKTDSIVIIDSNIVDMNISILHDGGSLITSKGVCWSNSPSPDIQHTTTINAGQGDAGFTSRLSTLNKCNMYYIRPYVTNSIGTAYGTETSLFITKQNNEYANFNPLLLSGDYLNTFDYLDSVQGSLYGPYKTIINEITNYGEISRNITYFRVKGIWDSTWLPVTFTLNYSYGNDFIVTLNSETALPYLGSTILGSNSPYSNWWITLAPSVLPGKLNACDNTLQLRMKLGFTDPANGNQVWAIGDYIVNMAR